MNKIRNLRLHNEFQRLEKLNSESSLFNILGTRGDPPDSYLFSFDLKSLVKTPGGEIEDYEGPHIVEIHCPAGYPTVDEPRVLFFRPPHIFHPNIRGMVICLNRWAPSIYLDEIVHRIAAVITYRTFTMDENVSLNVEACRYARNNQHRFPLDKRPLLDRGLKIEVR
jgi:ubiquitin-protein ligase